MTKKASLFLLTLWFLFSNCKTNNHKDIVGNWKICGGLIDKTMKMYEPCDKIIFAPDGSGSIFPSFDSASNFKWSLNRDIISILFSGKDSSDILKNSNYIVEESKGDNFYTFLLKDSLNSNMIFLSK